MEEKQFDVTAIGELLIDFIQYGMSEQGNPLFEANPGGAPCNVLSMLAGLGNRTAFVGKVGEDGFGRQLCTAVKEQGIDVGGLVFDGVVHTTLALVHRLENGDRDFSFYRKPGADMRLTAGELLEDRIRSARLFHFGSLSMTDEPVRSATMRAISLAEESGAMISFDPNLRIPLWDSLELAKEQIAIGMAHCDLMKISDNEIQWFTGKEDFDEGAAVLLENNPGLRLLLVSLGPGGSLGFYRREPGQPMDQVTRVFVPAFLQEGTIETTGAGDTFMGSMLHHVLRYGLDGLDADRLKQALTFANAAASIITTRKGALRVMPKQAEIEAFLKEKQAEA